MEVEQGSDLSSMSDIPQRPGSHQLTDQETRNRDVLINAEQNLENFEAGEKLQETCKKRITHISLSLTFRLMLNTAFGVGVIPIYWETQTFVVKTIDSKCLLSRCYVTLTTILVMGTIMAAILVHSTTRDGFQMSNMRYVQSIMTVS